MGVPGPTQSLPYGSRRNPILIDDPSDNDRIREATNPGRKRTFAATTADLDAPFAEPPKKRTKKPNANDDEKRLRRFRTKPTGDFRTKLERAMTQPMFVLERTRFNDGKYPEEEIEIAGTTGNIYKVSINKTPSCTCPSSLKDGQCKHIIYVLVRVLKAPAHLQYQLALLSSELREIFVHAPPVPSKDPKAEQYDGKRKPIEDDCPICCIEFEPDKEEIVYCKAACGNNMHQACFQQWATQKRSAGVPVTCPFCRTPWEKDNSNIKIRKEAGRMNHGGYLNVADQLGISTIRDTRSYHDFWVRRENRNGRRWDIDGDYI